MSDVDYKGQIASLKDHLRLADAQCDAWARLARARGAAMQTFDDDHPECVAAREALEALGVEVLPEVQSPITDAAIDAAIAETEDDTLGAYATEDQIREARLAHAAAKRAGYPGKYDPVIWLAVVRQVEAERAQ